MTEPIESQLLYDPYGNVLPWGKGNAVGQFVFIAGTEGRDPATDVLLDQKKPVFTALVIGGPREQTLLTWSKIKTRLEDFGTSLENITWIKHYVPRREDWTAVREAEMEFFRKNCPDLAHRPRPETTLMNVGLDLRDMAIEIEVWAMRRGADFKIYPQKDRRGELVPRGKGVAVKPFVILSAADGTEPETQLVLDGDRGITAAVVAGGPAEQTTEAWSKIKSWLEEMGTSLENIVYVRHNIARRQDWVSIREAEIDFFKKHCPDLTQRPRPGTTLKNIGLDLEGEALVAIEAVAVLPGTEFKIYPRYDRYGELMPYAKGVTVAGKFAILSGVDGVDPATEVVIDTRRRIAAGMAAGDPKEQMEMVWSKVKSWLEERGTSLENMVHECPRVANRADWPAVAGVQHVGGRIATAGALLRGVGLDSAEMAVIQDSVIAAIP